MLKNKRTGQSAAKFIQNGYPNEWKGSTTRL